MKYWTYVATKTQGWKRSGPLLSAESGRSTCILHSNLLNCFFLTMHHLTILFIVVLYFYCRCLIGSKYSFQQRVNIIWQALYNDLNRSSSFFQYYHLDQICLRWLQILVLYFRQQWFLDFHIIRFFQKNRNQRFLMDAFMLFLLELEILQQQIRRKIQLKD